MSFVTVFADTPNKLVHAPMALMIKAALSRLSVNLIKRNHGVMVAQMNGALDGVHLFAYMANICVNRIPTHVMAVP